MTEKSNTGEITKQDKVISLFQFIAELNKLKQKVVLKAKDYQWYRSIASFPNDPENIQIYYRDRVQEEDLEHTTDILLAVHKPEFQRCPEPDVDIREWLEDGWEDYRQEVAIKETSNQNSIIFQKDIEEPVENFYDDEVRVNHFEVWIEERRAWAQKQKVYAETRDFFTELYKISVDLERESETLELVVADGFIRDRNKPEIDHPILTRRVKIRYDAVENTIYITDADVETELYTILFQNMEEINLGAVNRMHESLRQNDYHPLDRNELPMFFQMFVHQLSGESIYAENGVPEDWKKQERLLLYRNPCYILRKRLDGALKAIEQIIEDVEETNDIPNPIRDIVEGGKIDIPEDTGEASIEEQLAAVGGESVDILLSKEANKEQLEIARRIEQYNAVLVQGPPGTGKTHTIANLMGHFLAQGKSVLVTSHTKKALSVLKEKVVPGIQSLCVSMLDDSNVDMEKSIDGITDYMSYFTSFEVKKDMEGLAQDRAKVIQDLADVRKKLFAMIHQECDCIVFQGESISPSKAASFVLENEETLSYIPGKVRLHEPLPLSFSELNDLYRSNGEISAEDETELGSDLPNPKDLMSPHEFEQMVQQLQQANGYLESVSREKRWKIENSVEEKKISIIGEDVELYLPQPNQAAVNQLRSYVSTFHDVEPWMLHCAVDGKKGGRYRQLWLWLIEQIEKTCQYAEKTVADRFGKEIKILNQDPSFASAVKQLHDKFQQSGKIGKIALLLNKQLEMALNGVTINGQKPQNAEDCALILQSMELDETRRQCASYWNDLIAKYGVPSFYDLDTDEPERVAANYIPWIQRYLDWYEKEYTELIGYLDNVGLPCDMVFRKNPLDSEAVATEKILYAIGHVISSCCEIFNQTAIVFGLHHQLEQNKDILKSEKRITSDICKTVLKAMENGDVSMYRNAYDILEQTYVKYDLQRKREAYLNRLSPVAWEWAEAIRNRTGIHGSTVMPADLEDAWKWKQYYGIIEEIASEPFSELQKKSLFLSKTYREVTANYAEKCAWYHLLSRTEHDIDMKQALMGWKQTVKKIGKGTGKKAPMYRAKARKLMAKCQKAVPAWIMPMGKALESLNPKENKFDVVIIDEASQSDISSLAILYMGKKLVIVGDDKQVSPMAVGTDSEKINSLQEMYLTGKIPNAHLYDAKTSIYDIAATTFQPLMLREHFRCVPDIIGFSNKLSYDFKIKPLRDCSKNLLRPAVVNYRVENGERIDKTNPNEAKAIVALMQACMEQPEYADKTFGVISLLGDEQVKKLQEEIYQSIDAKECSQHHILCGNASNFQGDERDVIFLSVVDCANGNGPLTLRGYGPDDAYRKRYNVATSRAKDQLWVVDSIDPANDLKQGDIRKELIEYSLNPEAITQLQAQIEKKAESPFESAVAKYLVARGYHLVQQWQVGAYRLDMVVVCGNQKVAIECDGERYHSGEEKIREDMERQTILERLGWRFIRIRGSEYYRNPDRAMERVIHELTELEIEPETSEVSNEMNQQETELLLRIKKRAHEILSDAESSNPLYQRDTIAAALDPKNHMISDCTVEEMDICMDQSKKVDTKVLQQKYTQECTAKSTDVCKQMTLLDISTVPDKKPEDIDFIDFLRSTGVSYIDKRANGGSLWIVGGKELLKVVGRAKDFGYTFHFKEEGGRATGHQPGWWTR